MSVKILFTADNHIGISYNSFGAAKNTLQEERIASFKKMVDYANEQSINYLIIGGDLFDKTTIADKKIKEVAKILEAFSGGMVLIIPGNHDFYETDKNSLWHKFSAYVDGEKIVVLKDYQVFEHEFGNQPIHFYPACCRSLHSAENMIGWIKSAEKNNEVLNIGIAHGNVTGLGLDNADKYFNMTKEELKQANMDLWLLGHIHVPYPAMEKLSENPGIFMAGTHMPDSWDYRHYGNCWHIEIDDQKNVQAKRYKPSEIKIDVQTSTLNNQLDVDNLEVLLNNCNKSETALRLNMNGRLDLQLKERVENIVASHETQFLKLDVIDSIVGKIDTALINQKYPNNSLPHILLSELVAENPEGLAVQKAYEILEQLSIKK
jgi:DNA repair exonuclease SbcCD nuclease subunit